MMIFGLHAKTPALIDIFTHIAAAWLGPGVHLVRYEEILKALQTIDTDEGAAYFQGLLEACGIDIPSDWKARVLVGSDRKIDKKNLSIFTRRASDGSSATSEERPPLDDIQSGRSSIFAIQSGNSPILESET
ncbi:hypothetical protein LTR94_031546 [Friedmanniomyces endolithicus]|nr:hypothetical protein LTR94_031546 [Friedmanniomyces endolithicus]